ncbi:hypothetical protein ASPU41_16720 [Arthrobacter sp. U41]|nr:hypothetical protein ASPU41_16720 [Arthrobacter sp. U41]
MASSMSAVIRDDMGRHRLSGNRLAAMAGVSQNYMAKRLRDDAPLTLDDVEVISAALDVPVLALFNESAQLAEKRRVVIIRDTN